PWFRLGGTRKCVVDARVVAATNLPLEENVESGRFRLDLFHRLNVLHIHVPALRERIEDIEPLAQCFLRSANLAVSPAALCALRPYSWPGNVRELKNVLFRAALFARGRVLELNDLPREIVASSPAISNTGFALDQLEEQTIRRALLRTGGHQQR